MSFTNKAGKTIVDGIIEAIQSNKQMLSDIDGLIGDGDHGINMNKGFSIAKECLMTKEYNMSDGFKVIGDTLMIKIGGSMGPLYGVFFQGLQEASESKEIIDEKVMLRMIEKSYQNITMISDAQPNDKTLIDVLYPAYMTYKKCIENNMQLIESLKEMALAANQGLENTKAMVAKVGRASRLGNRSIGFQDAGATSCNIILQTFIHEVMKIEEEYEHAAIYK